MNTVITTPEVRLFVTAVRERLVDLTEEEREELVGGLDADVSDLVGERGVDALPEPAAYARELRAAAGFDPETRPVRSGFRAGERVTTFLDASHAKWDALVEGLPGDPWGLFQVLRPVWWILRAWIALQVVDLLWGRGSTGAGLSVIPSLDDYGLPLLVVAALVSIQVGRGKLWPGRPVGGPVGRLLLLVLNVLALACVPVTFHGVHTAAEPTSSRSQADVDDAYQNGYAEGKGQYDRAGMYVDGRWVSNIYPYDAAGRPIVGVQLFDQVGRPVSVKPQTECVYSSDEQPTEQVRAYYPWTTANGQVRNVFPVPSREQGPSVAAPDPAAFTGSDRPTVGHFPLASVPAAGLPGLTVSRASTPRTAYAAGVGSGLPINPVQSGC